MKIKLSTGRKLELKSITRDDKDEIVLGGKLSDWNFVTELNKQGE